MRGNRLMLRAGTAERTMLDLRDGQPLRDGARVPVAVLIDGGTASSGEITAIAFAGRARTARFGAPTYGVSTSTSGFPLSDRANLVIVDSLVQDRTGRKYLDGLKPDLAVPPADAPLAAKRWLARRCGR